MSEESKSVKEELENTVVDILDEIVLAFKKALKNVLRIATQKTETVVDETLDKQKELLKDVVHKKLKKGR